LTTSTLPKKILKNQRRKGRKGNKSRNAKRKVREEISR
jgi:hypothetical protein